MAKAVKLWGIPTLEPEELWTIRRDNNSFLRTPYGVGEGDVTESNTLQLWSLTSLAPMLEE